MMHSTFVGRRAVFGALLVLAAAGGAVSAKDKAARFHAVGVNLSGTGATTVNLDISIERWTTDEELTRLRDALTEKGSDGLLRELQNIKPRVGSIRRADGGLGWDLRYARKVDLPGGGQRITFGTDRPMTFHERVARPRSADYEFLLGEIRIGADGKGEGKLVPAAKVDYDPDRRVLEIENYASQPVRLTQVRALDRG